jgi:murein DD-endopeptidase MepM/ murein hydrolase activator NlpD
MRHLFVFVLLLAAVLSLPAAVFAQDPPDRAQQIAQIEEQLTALADGLEAEDLASLTPEARIARLEARVALIESRLARGLDRANEIATGIFGWDARLLGVATDRYGPDAMAAMAVLASAPADAGLLSRFLWEWAQLERTVERLRLLRADLVAVVGDPRVCPVDGPHEFEDTWGEARAWGRSHKGTDMEAERGTHLVAIESGRIIQADWHWAGGRGLYLLGAVTGDVYYYAHLDGYAPGIEPGVTVTAGEHVGYVGWTGNADVSHLHLGWMPDGATLDDLENPYDLLVTLCG